MANRTLKRAGGANYAQTHIYFKRLIWWLAVLDEVIPTYTGRAMTGLTLSKKEDGWLLVLRGKNGSGPEVAFTAGPRPHDCLVELASKVKHGGLRWRPDKYGGK